MSKYWEEPSELVDPEDRQAWLDEYKEDEIIERELEERKGIKNDIHNRLLNLLACVVFNVDNIRLCILVKR